MLSSADDPRRSWPPFLWSRRGCFYSVGGKESWWPSACFCSQRRKTVARVCRRGYWDVQADESADPVRSPYGARPAVEELEREAAVQKGQPPKFFNGPERTRSLAEADSSGACLQTLSLNVELLHADLSDERLLRYRSCHVPALQFQYMRLLNILTLRKQVGYLSNRDSRETLLWLCVCVCDELPLSQKIRCFLFLFCFLCSCSHFLKRYFL